jgi:hypothetical protein
MVDGVMELLLDTPYHEYERERFRRGRRPQGVPRQIDRVPEIRRLIRLLVRYDKADRERIGLARAGRRYTRSGAIFRTATTYEDIFALCRQIDYWMHGLSDNALTTAFLDRIASDAGTLVKARDRRARIVGIGQLAIAATTFIQTVVANALHSTNTVGFDVILDLVGSPAVTQVVIVTLNHDTLVEQLLARAGIDVVDGFGPPDGDVRWYNDAQYDIPDARVKLIKLHGSIDWYDFKRGQDAIPAVLLRGEAAEAADAAGKRLNVWSVAPSFLSGGDKEAWYQHGIYADLHYRFHQALRECDRMVMSGYGWGDTGITNQIDRWLEQQPSRRLVLLHERPEEIRERSPIAAKSYELFVERQQLIPIRSWMCNTRLPTLSSVLGD